MRYPDWPIRLAQSLEDSRARAFGYGDQDCMLFAAAHVLAITGVDHGAQFRGYTTKRQALQIVSGYGSLEVMVTALLGEPVHRAHARRGDVVIGQPPLVEGEEGESIGICVGARCAFPAAVGFVLLPMSAARLAWRIE